MSTSPREKEAANQLGYLRGLAPQISQPTFNLRETLQNVLGGIDRSTAFTKSALSQDIGAQLSGSGVAGGQPRIESYISALAPVFSQASLAKANTTSDLSKFAATNEQQAKQLLLALTGQQGDVLSMLKNSTGFGDILGLLQALGSIGGSILQIPGVSPGGGNAPQIDTRGYPYTG